ncbi:MAG TPA: ABC transporter ATP-binding protein [Chitinivibrionales bacterium]
MDSYHEDDPVNVKLFNRDVLAMLFKYLGTYKKHLFLSLGLVVLITASTLSVPALTRYIIDHLIIKQGVTATVESALNRRCFSEGELREITKGIRLSDTLYFLLQSRLSYFSADRVKRLTAEGVLSKDKYTLIERPALTPELSARIDRALARRRVIAVSAEMFCIASEELKTFGFNDLLKLRADDVRRTGFIMLLVLAIFCIQFAAAYLQIITLMRLSQNALRDLRRDLFAHILSLELSFFDKNPIGKLVNRVTNDIEVLNELFSSVLITFFQDMLIVSGIIVIMFTASATLGAVVAITFPALIVITILFRAQARGAYRLIRSKIAHMNAFLNEHISGIRIVQIFVQQQKQIDKFSAINKDVFNANMRQVYVYGIFRPLIDFFRWFAIAGAIFAGAMLIAHDRISYGLVVMFLSYIGTFFEPLGDLAEKFDTLQSATAAGEKIMSVFKAAAVKESPDSTALLAIGGKSARPPTLPTPLAGEVRFDNIRFSYTADQWVLNGVSFSIPARASVAVVGPTGSGKTTIANLLSGFYRPQQGAIFVDNIDIKDIPLQTLRSNIATVMQDVFLFSRTVAQNITLNRPFNLAAFEQACRLSHCDTFLSSLPLGRDEMVMERGATFSTGQRQLLAIARALYFDPAILILDEATSNIDTETERLIQDAIARLITGRTSLIIAHRLSTVRNADIILVLDKGVIVEHGDHESLLAARGMYYDLYKLQFEGA